MGDNRISRSLWHVCVGCRVLSMVWTVSSVKGNQASAISTRTVSVPALLPLMVWQQGSLRMYHMDQPAAVARNERTKAADCHLSVVAVFAKLDSILRIDFS